MNIRINEDYRITSDSLNVIIERMTIAKKDTKNLKAGQEVWHNDGNFYKLEEALSGLQSRMVKESDVQTISELKQLLIICTGTICEAVKGHVCTCPSKPEKKGALTDDTSDRPRE